MSEFTNVKKHLGMSGDVIGYSCTFEGHDNVFVPIDEDTREYVILKSKIDAGDITPADADPLVT
tara:strand:- start:16 stop:207 length:192 start_codon:yes stop_codon:yes gene_type:complete